MENAYIYHSPPEYRHWERQKLFFKYTLIAELFLHSLVYMAYFCDFCLYLTVIKLKIKCIEGQM